jgi:hypothetical protein
MWLKVQQHTTPGRPSPEIPIRGTSLIGHEMEAEIINRAIAFIKRNPVAHKHF